MIGRACLPAVPVAPSKPPTVHLASKSGSRALLVALLALLVVPSCRVDQDEFNNRIFGCNVASPDRGCGVDETGRAMECFGGRQVGATDFCAKTCDIDAPAGEDAVCLQSGIALRVCHPGDDANTAAFPRGACDQKNLKCYRTDLLSDEGVCTTMAPCNADIECRDPIRSVCATSFLANLYSKARDVLRNDHMYCLQTGCRSRGASCSAGETCLQEVIPAAAHPPDICVPNCDSNLNCPPNFLCYRKVSTPATPNVCIPGLLGFTCLDALDCMMGDCVDTGIGYKVCTTPCDTQTDCTRFDGEQGKFICIKNQADPSEPGRCQAPDSYRGSLCNDTQDCLSRPGEVCSRFNPKDGQGSCLLPCTPEGKCGPRVGINHTCLPALVDGGRGNVCFPGYFGLPCGSDGNCFDGLECHATAAPAPSICTVRCSASAECQANRWIGGDGWCHPLLGICVSKLNDEATCGSNEACKSGTCTASRCAVTTESAR